MGTTHSSTWKAFERQVSKFFNTTRTPLSGMCANLTKSDTMHDKLFIECKLRGDFPVVDHFHKHRENAKKLKNLNPTILRVANGLRYRQGDLWVFDYLQLEKVCDAVVEGVLEDGSVRRMTIRNRINLVAGVKGDALLSLYADTEAKAKLENKVPVVAIKKKNTVGWLIAVNPAYISQVKNIMIVNHNG